MAASYGRLSGFISSISASMAIAEDTVAGAVQSMLAQLSRLNTTVTTTININRNETTRRKTIVEPPQTGRNMPFMDVHAPVPVGIDIGETPRRFDVRAAGASQQSVNWGRTAVRVIEDSRSSDNRGVVKNYEFNIEAAPNVPTEKQIIKQQRKADALYGD